MHGSPKTLQFHLKETLVALSRASILIKVQTRSDRTLNGANRLTSVRIDLIPLKKYDFQAVSRMSRAPSQDNLPTYRISWRLPHPPASEVCHYLVNQGLIVITVRVLDLCE